MEADVEQSDEVATKRVEALAGISLLLTSGQYSIKAKRGEMRYISVRRVKKYLSILMKYYADWVYPSNINLYWLQFSPSVVQACTHRGQSAHHLVHILAFYTLGFAKVSVLHSRQKGKNISIRLSPARDFDVQEIDRYALHILADLLKFLNHDEILTLQESVYRERNLAMIHQASQENRTLAKQAAKQPDEQTAAQFPKPTANEIHACRELNIEKIYNSSDYRALGKYYKAVLDLLLSSKDALSGRNISSSRKGLSEQNVRCHIIPKLKKKHFPIVNKGSGYIFDWDMWNKKAQ